MSVYYGRCHKKSHKKILIRFEKDGKDLRIFIACGECAGEISFSLGEVLGKLDRQEKENEPEYTYPVSQLVN